MDTTDLKILALLEENSRISYTDISKMVNLSLPSVIDRINKLIDKQVILKNTIEINYKCFNRNIMAIIGVDVKTSNYNDFIKYCRNNKFVHEFYRVVGEYNTFILISVENTEELEIFIDGIKRFGRTRTNIVTDTYFRNSISYDLLNKKEY